MIPSRFNIFEAAFLLRYFSEAFLLSRLLRYLLRRLFAECGLWRWIYDVENRGDMTKILHFELKIISLRSIQA